MLKEHMSLKGKNTSGHDQTRRPHSSRTIQQHESMRDRFLFFLRRPWRGKRRRGKSLAVYQSRAYRAKFRLTQTFLPHFGNNYQPHALRPRALKAYAGAVIVAKVAVTALLFIVYPNPGSFSTATAERFFTLTNTARIEAGAKPLALNAKLARAAERKAADILAQGYFAHSTPQGKKFYQWIKEEGYKYSAAGENLALDFSDAEIAHEALMDSPGHRSNIINKKYTQVGFAVKSGTFQGRKTTVLVELFGKPVPVMSRPVVKAAEVEAPKPEPTPTPAPSPTPAPLPPPTPVYAALLASPATVEATLASGASQAVTVAFENRGTATWTRDGEAAVTLDAIAPTGRVSALAATGWESTSRPARLAPDRVAPGETGRWVFSIVGPKEPGAYVERFGLVHADGTEMTDAAVTLTITVEAPAAQDPAPVPAITTPDETTPSAPEPDETTETIATTGEIVPPEPLPRATEGQSTILASLVRAAVASTNGAFVALIAFLTIALLVNVVVRYEVQHRHIIAGTLFMIVLTAGVLALGVHFLQLKPILTPLLA